MANRFDTSTSFPGSIWNPRHYTPAEQGDGSPRTMWLYDDGSLVERADDVSQVVPSPTTSAVYQQGEDDPGRFDLIWSQADGGSVGNHPQKTRWEALAPDIRQADEGKLQEAARDANPARRGAAIELLILVVKERRRRARSDEARAARVREAQSRARPIPVVPGRP